MYTSRINHVWPVQRGVGLLVWRVRRLEGGGGVGGSCWVCGGLFGIRNGNGGVLINPVYPMRAHGVSHRPYEGQVKSIKLSQRIFGF